LKNRSINDEVKAYEVKAYKKCASFFGHPVVVFCGRYKVDLAGVIV